MPKNGANDAQPLSRNRVFGMLAAIAMLAMASLAMAVLLQPRSHSAAAAHAPIGFRLVIPNSAA